MEECPICTEPSHRARVVCAGCGEPLPLRVVLISEGSRGDGGFALVEEVRGGENADLRDQPTENQHEEASL